MTELHPLVGSMVTELTDAMNEATRAAEEGDFSKLQQLAKNSGNDSMFWEMVPSHISQGIRTANLIAHLAPDDKRAIHEACNVVRTSLTNLGLEVQKQ